MELTLKSENSLKSEHFLTMKFYSKEFRYLELMSQLNKLF